jgi:hypothetical protein
MKASREEHLAEAETYFLRLAETAAPEGQIIRRATLAAPRQRHKAVPTGGILRIGGFLPTIILATPKEKPRMAIG